MGDQECENAQHIYTRFCLLLRQRVYAHVAWQPARPCMPLQPEQDDQYNMARSGKEVTKSVYCPQGYGPHR
jgi:hypothetical protein